MKSFCKIFSMILSSRLNLSVSPYYLVFTLFISISLNLKAQHNYDNQSIIYSKNGKVGIGTTTPSEKLEINGSYAKLGSTGSNSYWIASIPSNSRYGAGIRMDVGNDMRSFVYYSNNGSNNYFGVDLKSDDGSFLPSPLRILASNGNVGIGTYFPSAKLDVNGDTRANMIRIGGGDHLRIGEWHKDDVMSFKAKLGYNFTYTQTESLLS